MPALKLLTESAWTISLGKAFHIFAVLLKKKFSLYCCLEISLKYLKQWPLTWLLINWKRLLFSTLSILCIILYNWMRSPLFLLSTSVVISSALSRFVLSAANFNLYYSNTDVKHEHIKALITTTNPNATGKFSFFSI